MTLYYLIPSASCISLTAQQLLVGQGLIIEASRSHSDTPRLVGLLWTSDQLDAETSLPDKALHSQETDIKPAIPAGERAQTHAFARATTWIGFLQNTYTNNKLFLASSP
jgi:hypothetical protein